MMGRILLRILDVYGIITIAALGTWTVWRLFFVTV